MHPECAPALVSGSPPAADLTVNTLEISQAAQFVDASCGVKTRYSNPADHQSSEHDSALRAKPGSLHNGRLQQLDIAAALPTTDLSDAKVRFAYRSQCFYSALDTLGLCQFVWGPSWQLYGPSDTVELVRAGTGWDATMEELLTVGERRIALMRAFNAREGMGKDADTLPKKLFQPLGGTGPTAGVALTTEEFERARDSYYQLAGCDPATGYPTRAKLAELGLDWVAEKVAAAR